MNIPTIAILTAMPVEFQFFLPHLKKIETIDKAGQIYYQGDIGGKQIVGSITSIGQTNSALVTTSLLHQFNPDILIFSGIAGALHKKISIGDIVMGKTVFSAELLSISSLIDETHDDCQYGVWPSMQFLASDALVQTIYTSAAGIHKGTLVSSDFFPVPTYIPPSFLGASVDAIDMESAAFYQVCEKFNKPCVSIRGISNYAFPQEKAVLRQADVLLAAERAANFVIQWIESI